LKHHEVKIGGALVIAHERQGAMTHGEAVSSMALWIIVLLLLLVVRCQR